MKVSIGQKLMLSFLSLALMVGVLGFLGYSTMRTTGDQLDTITKVETPGLTKLTEMKSHLLEGIEEAFAYLLLDDPHEKAEFYQKLDQFDTSAVEFEKITHIGQLGQEEETELYIQIVTAKEALEKGAGNMFESYERDGTVDQPLVVAFETRIDALIPLIDDFLEIEVEEVAEAQQRIESTIGNAKRLTLILVSASVILAIGLGILVSGSISRPIARLRNAAIEFGNGNFGIRTAIDSSDEIGQLARSFNDMASGLEVAREQLEEKVHEADAANKNLESEIVERREVAAQLAQSNRELEALFNIANILSQSGDFKSKTTTVMDRLAELTGADWVTLRMPSDGEPGMRLVAASGTAVFDTPPFPVLTDRETLACKAVREGRMVVTNDYPNEPNASPNIVALNMKSMALIPIKSGDRSLGMVNVVSSKPDYFTPDLVKLLSAIADGMGVLLENASLAQQVKDKTVELESFNANLARQVEARTVELESFSYSVSHDLRAPLRSINGFGQALYEDYAGQLDDQGKEYLERVRSSTQKMEQLIDGLLDLARVSRSEIETREIDLTQMANSIVSALRENNPERDVNFSVQEHLVDHGDPRLLRVALENLLGNAWKYTAKQPTALIEFGIDAHNGAKAYFIRDDGAGFDMAYADKLFGAFQRLHANSEYEGTGIGLATVQRIVQRHGGKVWAEGKVDHGATFYFTLR